MRLLTKAKPNLRYRWYQSVKDVILEARLCNNKILYYEIWTKKERRISEENVNNMFKTGCSIRDQPFLIRENREFYAVLKRKHQEYFPLYKQIKNRKFAK